MDTKQGTEAVREHIVSTAPRLLGVGAEAVRAALSAAPGKLRDFVAQGHVRRLVVRANETGGDGKRASGGGVSIDTEVGRGGGGGGGRASSVSGLAIVFIKCVPALEPAKPLTEQLRVCQLKSDSPYEAMLHYVRHAFLPYSRAALAEGSRSGSGGAGENFTVLRAVMTKLSELEVSLLRCQRSIDIPHVVLQTHPTIEAVVARCTAAGRRPTTDDLPRDLDLDKFLNELQRGLGEWKKLIRSVTKLDWDVSTGSTKDEIHFWASMDRALAAIEKQLRATPAEYAFSVLKENQRWLAVTGFREECDLTQSATKVEAYNKFLRDFPIRGLVEAVSIDEIAQSIERVYVHMQGMKSNEYPSRRVIALVGTLSRDICAQIRDVLSAKRLLSIDYSEFKTLSAAFDALKIRWKNNAGLFRDDMREVIKSRKEDTKLLEELDAEPEAKARLDERLYELRSLRKGHNDLLEMVRSTFGRDGIAYESSRQKIDAAYAALVEAEPLGRSGEADAVWARTVKAYRAQIETVERELEERIRDILDAAKGDANEMFRVCQKFNHLFSRPQIQAAIREYQQPLINNVKEGIHRLQEKFKTDYERSEAFRMSRVKDLPPVAGAIIWLKQIESQLKQYMRQLETVLGKNWHQHVEGRKLLRIYRTFRLQLEHSINKDQYDKWKKRWSDAQPENHGSIFRVETKGSEQQLVVNFNKELIELYKEVRVLSHIEGMRLPYNIMVIADEAKRSYPNAIRLEEVLRIYKRACARLDERPNDAPLVARLQKKVQDIMVWGVEKNFDWTSEEQLPNMVKKLGGLVQRFQEQVDDLMGRSKQVESALQRASRAGAENDVIRASVAEIQSAIDHFERHGFSNLGPWVQAIDAQLEEVLAGRMREHMELWCEGVRLTRRELVAMAESVREAKAGPEDERPSLSRREELERAARITGVMSALLKDPITHEICIESSVISVRPPLLEARLRMVDSLQRVLANICELPRLTCWDIKRATANSRVTQTFRSSLAKVSSADLGRCLEAADESVLSAEKYVMRWLQYQTLWDMDVDNILEGVDDDVQSWERLLRDMKASRSAFKDGRVNINFGPIIVQCQRVQEQVMGKVDSWHKSVVAAFSHKLGSKMKRTFGLLSDGRKTLEGLSMDFRDTEELAINLVRFQELRNRAEAWGKEVKAQAGVEKMLERQRFVFPSDWLYSERVVGEWNSFQQILSMKVKVIETETPALQRRIADEDAALGAKLRAFAADWKRDRPVGSGLDHRAVVKSLSLFRATLDRLEAELKKVQSAKRALDIPFREDTSLRPIREELSGLTEVWERLGSVFERVERLGEAQLQATKPEQIRAELKRCQEQLDGMPNHMRSYDAFDGLRKRLEGYQKLFVFFVTLTSSVLRRKHQRQILRVLRLDGQWQDLTVGQLWAVDLARHRSKLEEIQQTAQGESALEEYLAQVASAWEETRFEQVEYQKKCFLIRNWNVMFALLADHLTDLTSMRQSPYYKVFERDAGRWEETLNLAQAILEVFSEVQRRWIYLEGIFSNSLDVQQQLASQFRRFKAFDREFVRLMREIRLEPAVLYWFRGERSLLSRLEQHKEVLTTIQKALGTYLEKQRSQFPRFYFVGDDDLLEIIGNAKDPAKILRHLPKMFAGIAALLLAKDKHVIEGMASREGEVVKFKQAVNTRECKTIHDWLRRVEGQMQASLAGCLGTAVPAARSVVGAKDLSGKAVGAWVESAPAQVVLLSSLVSWTSRVGAALKESRDDGTAARLGPLVEETQNLLVLMAEQILRPMSSDRRKKYEQLITELMHQRDVIRLLVDHGVASDADFHWLSNLRFEFDAQGQGAGEQLQILISSASFRYGFEYLGVGERLVQTPLTDRCYLTLCEALHMRMGGNPFGPAGTGKTESVKMLGSQLGRFVLIFCCDESFDLAAMSRIFVGLCQCGAWGCFDEFNRLEERILSAVSQQIQTIQEGLRAKVEAIELAGKTVQLNQKMGIFVTMNPGYAGRSNLPDNLKQLFRGIAMMKPDRNLIAQVTLFSQGFRSAEHLASKMVLIFELCKDQLSEQSHYDFGLRSLKSVLRSAGVLKRQQAAASDAKAQKAWSDAQWREWETELLVKSMCMTVVPKLILQDLGLFRTLLTAVFPRAKLLPPNVDALRKAILTICRERNYLPTQAWIDKIMELNQIQTINHGVIVVGDSGTGKSTAWRVLLEALERVDKGKVKSECYVIDPKAISKDELYGTLDPTTLEWTNGVFTHILRKILDDVRGEGKKRHWIVFDGDVDPEWAENLNSVLDDNKLLTLPNGERLMLSDDIRIVFEVSNLDSATPATVSRCGMVWFHENVVSNNMICYNLLEKLSRESIGGVTAAVRKRWSRVQEQCARVLKKELQVVSFEDIKDSDELADQPSPFIDSVLEYCASKTSIMPLQPLRALGTLFSLLQGGVSRVMLHNDTHPDFPLAEAQVAAFMRRYLLVASVWAFGGSLSLKDRTEFCAHLATLTNETVPPTDEKSVAAGIGGPLIDFDVRVDTAEWESWSERVAQVELEPEKIPKPDVVIDTVDIVRHSDIIGAAVANHRPLVLCGPPGSGKSMTLMAVLRALPDFELVTLNFSSSTDPDLLMKTLSHYCKRTRTSKGLVMSPAMQDKHLVVFCDEINLPEADGYGTQAAITFIRQVVEQGGFWDSKELAWITLERVQIIGACNPPTDAGRVAMTPRFLRHIMLLFVDFPAPASLRQIYGTFNRALVKRHPTLRGYAEAITDAMVEFYLASQARFTPAIQPHYIYSPRELSRWVRAMYEAMDPGKVRGNALLPEDMVRLFAHEALRLFQDRLVDVEERKWTDDRLDECVRKHFGDVDLSVCLQRPILFSEWLSKQYVSVGQEELRKHVQARLRTFNEEELDVKLVVFDEVLEHILRIDRALRQPLGHLLLVGASGSGKTILSKFVSWMNGMKVFQIKVHKQYTTKNFDEDLRGVLIRSGCKHEKICFIFDESNVLDTAFLERMNALLASGEVPGLFEDADFVNLMQECKEMGRREGEVLGSDEERYKRFCKHVQRNLHVVFTMNPSNEDFDNRSATSPALFNRCIIDWFGEWSDRALYQVGLDFTQTLDLGDVSRDGGGSDRKMGVFEAQPGSQREAVVNTMVYMHKSVQSAMKRFAEARNLRATFVTPRHYLDFIQHYKQLFVEKRELFEEQQMHLRSGLKKLRQTEETVATMRTELNLKNEELKKKEREAKQKMEQIQKDSIEAENQRQASLKIKKEQEEQNKVISARRAKVETDLAEAGPMLEKAQESVREIKKRHLDEMRQLRKPPKLLKLGMEPVVMMVTGSIDSKATDWASIRRILAKSDFIPNLLKFETRDLKPEVAAHIKANYMTNPKYTFESINYASRACGPLVLWVQSQIKFAEIILSVAPMERELKELEAKSTLLEDQQRKITALLDSLTGKIKAYSDEYKTLIAEATKIESELNAVKTKVERSVKLLANLGSESERWEGDSNEYEEQVSTLVGDTLLSAAFLAYIGYFNQGYREQLCRLWRGELEQQRVESKDDLNVVEYLSLPSDRLEWKAHQLPDDNLCIENAIIMTRFNRYPLIIDPSGQAVAFLLDYFNNNESSQRKMIRTSFLDSAFLKHLESALRFGNALLVEDVENIDPVLNSVLNREIFKSGGRVMITVGAKEIDFSPHFTIFLSTRDPTCHFTPDLCSRVTFVNFTATHASLASQCLNKVLKSERPDIDEKRTDLLKLQGEFKVQLRLLERQLLDALNSVKTNILEDDKVMSSLETLKSQALVVNQKMRDSQGVMEQVEEAVSVYKGFSVSAAQVYFTLEELSTTHFLYQFSLPYFLGVVDHTLDSNSNPALSGLSSEEKKNPTARLRVICKSLFEISFQRTSMSLLQRDHLAFALRLAQIALADKTQFDDALEPPELAFLLSAHPVAGKRSGGAFEPPEGLPLLEPSKSAMLAQLCSLDGFSGLSGHIKENVRAWAVYIGGESKENGENKVESDSKNGGDGSADEFADVPMGWEGANGPVAAFRRMLVAKTLRAETLERSGRAFVEAVFGPGFLEGGPGIDQVFKDVVRNQVSASTPVLLVTLPGYDASQRVLSLAGEVQQQCSALAMGSPEGYSQADAAINVAARKGRWILCSNVHLASGWLANLEKRLHRLEPHRNFRLFLTMEMNPSVPANLVRMSRTAIFEPPSGIKASMRRIFAALPRKRVDRAPAERSRLYFLLAWLHSVVLERLRYAPVGWTKRFEFSEADQRCAMDVIDEWVDKVARGRLNVRPEELPWDAIRTTIEKVIYGGRIDNAYDHERLRAFVAKLFTPRSYGSGFALASAYDEAEQSMRPLVAIPDCRDYNGFSAWIAKMKDLSSPEYLGLPANARLLLQREQASRTVRVLKRLQSSDAHADVAAAEDENAATSGPVAHIPGAGAGAPASSQPAWWQRLRDLVGQWRAALPAKLGALPSGNEGNALVRCLQRENSMYRAAFDRVSGDLAALSRVFEGKQGPTNHTRAVMKSLGEDDRVPRGWDARATGVPMSAADWMQDFVRRVEGMNGIAATPIQNLGSRPIWLGGILAPEAFLAASRQAVARELECSLDSLQLKVTISESDKPLDNDFIFSGLVLHGAACEQNTLRLTDAVAQKLPLAHFQWVASRKNADTKGVAGTKSIPVYLDETRKYFLFSFQLPFADGLDGHVFSQRGTCATVWAPPA